MCRIKTREPIQDEVKKELVEDRLHNGKRTNIYNYFLIFLKYFYYIYIVSRYNYNIKKSDLIV